MAASLTFNDLVGIGLPQIEELRRVGESFASAQEPGACDAFQKQVRLVEGSVRQTYAAAATLARRAESLEEAAEIWGAMSRFCQPAIQALSDLKNKYPRCGAPELYDLVLDFKLAADKRHKGTLEEIECLKTEFPEGIFPELS
jgi:hypothetical protein